MDLQEIQKLETSLFKLRKSHGEKWNFRLLNWSQKRGTLSTEFTDTDDEHLVVAVERISGGAVATGKIFIKVQENINLGNNYASILFYDGPTVALITEGRPFRPSSFLGYLGTFFQSVNRNASQVNYHVFSGTLCLCLAGAVRSPTVDGRFYVWSVSEAEINVTRAPGSSKCVCTVIKMSSTERNAHVHYRFKIPGAYLGFDNRETQYFIGERGILLSHGEFSDFADQLKCFAAPPGMLGSLFTYLERNCTFKEVRSWAFSGKESSAFTAAPRPSGEISSRECSSKNNPSTSQKLNSKDEKKLVYNVPTSQMNAASTITEYFPKVRR
ncbi:hypothetical protein [Neorickettsia findlayensis]|uniref:Uncharacterized protein n=1 Tax=Neorickettsia findlayensis TaxID=2686014 RepID=A0A6P1GAL0_9RICK|nr:hypothetical protein [Neorickettsia findlayensis]QHD65253.1 hypothetical protein GP480_02190 [Neorickettsia findlayensis]